MAGIANTNNTDLKKGLKSLVSLVIEYNILKKDTYEWGAFSFLSFVKIEGAERGKKATVEFALALPILESLVRPNMYVKLNLLLQRGFKSKYALALFEVLSDYKRVGKLYLEIDSLRNLLGIEPHKYKSFGMFRKKVLETIVNEINTLSSLQVSYEMEKVGRKFKYITFFMSGKVEETSRAEAKLQIRSKLQFYGFTDNQIQQLLKYHDEDYLLANISVIEEQLEQGKAIKNVKAYMAKAFEVDFRQTPTEFEKLKQAKKAEQEQTKAAEQQATERKELELAILKGKYKTERKAKLESLLLEFSAEELGDLKESFEGEILTNPFHGKIYQSKGFSYGAIQSLWGTFLAKQFLAKEYHNFENYSDKNFQVGKDEKPPI